MPLAQCAGFNCSEQGFQIMPSTYKFIVLGLFIVYYSYNFVKLMQQQDQTSVTSPLLHNFTQDLVLPWILVVPV